jgi:hypothetical protein
MGRAPDADGRAVALARRYLDSDELAGGWFALGGSSIDAARLVSALDAELGIRLSLRDLLEAGSVRECLLAAAGGQPAPAQPAPAQPAPAQPAAPAAAPGYAGAVAPPASGSAADLLWPVLAALPAHERVRLAHNLLGDVIADGAASPAERPVRQG